MVFSTDILKMHMRERTLRAVYAGLIIAGLATTFVALEGQKKLPRTNVTIRGHIISADVASAEADMERGLAGRVKLGVNRGMLFVFDNAGIHGIWMKGMKFPIDIIWIADGGVVSIKEWALPQPNVDDTDLKTFFPSTFDDYVLELPAGRVKAYGIEVGDTVTIATSTL